MMRRIGQRRAGFTLVEILAVILILGILMGFLVVNLTGTQEVVEAKNTRMFMSQLEVQITEYEAKNGDFPASTFPTTWRTPSTTNMGSEMLLIALFPASGKAQTQELDEARLSNTDGDSSKAPLADFDGREVFEVCDDWGNPIAYIHRRDYSKRFTYQTFDGKTGEPVDSVVQALKSGKTGNFYERSRFQLISAGPDGVFGTDDDVCNFSRE
ncbi:MAG: prepilin-type N-terminal cleavage/methylation domain-containing protein [Planctomycetota bacterium]